MLSPVTRPLTAPTVPLSGPTRLVPTAPMPAASPAPRPVPVPVSRVVDLGQVMAGVVEALRGWVIVMVPAVKEACVMMAANARALLGR